MTFTKRIITVVAAGALIAGSLAPLAFADTTISGNGAVSDNTVSLDSNSSTTLNQNNNANISNSVTNNSNTGGNNSDFNTGGSTAISTGNAGSNTNISTQANANIASVNNCNCNGANGTGTIAVVGNGAFSDNAVASSNTGNTTSLNQNNTANINNTVDNHATTGDNSSSFNTGGSTTILTGNTWTNTSIQNNANANIASLGGGNSGPLGSSVLIAGNGAESDNAAALDNGTTTTLNQNNNAHITNDVRNDSNIGWNNAGFNTSGNVLIGTGSINNSTNIANLANFNWANLASCGCMTGGNSITLTGNGAFSHNLVTDTMGDLLSANQNNWAGINNSVDNGNRWSGTGNNSSEFNTSDFGEPTLLFTGDTNNSTTLNSSANSNGFGSGMNMNIGGMDMSVFFDMNSLLNQLHI